VLLASTPSVLIMSLYIDNQPPMKKNDVATMSLVPAKSTAEATGLSLVFP
jgi:hypothetical protein